MPDDAVVITGGDLELTAHPAHGFVVSQLTDLETGTPLLWARDGDVPPCPADLGPPGEASIDTFDNDLLVGGWFTMFPTAGLPEADARARWMHGEAARLRWTIVGRDDHSVTAHVVTPASGFLLTRTVRLDAGGLSLRTVAVNQSGRSQEVTYGEHPCLSRPAFASGRIEQNASGATLFAPAQPSAASAAPGPVAAWPCSARRARAEHGGTGGARDVGLAAEVDLGAIPAGPDGAHDHVGIDLANGMIRVSAPRLSRVLELDVDLSELGHVLLWRHHLPSDRPWAADVFALEPSSSPGRGWADAMAAGAVRVVAPGERVEFGVRARWTTPGAR